MTPRGDMDHCAVGADEVSWCRHCGWMGQLTREHIPPRSVGNDAPVKQILNALDRKQVLQEVWEWGEGHIISSLCTECNKRASGWGYVTEYRRWFDLTVASARAMVAVSNEDPLRAGRPFGMTLPYDVMPARFVRQVLGMSPSRPAMTCSRPIRFLPSSSAPSRAQTTSVDGTASTSARCGCT